MSRQVKDPTTLRRIFERGEHARAEAERITADALGGYDLFPPANRNHSILVVMAAAGATGDVTGLVFREGVNQRALEFVNGPLAMPPVSGLRKNNVRADLNQGSMTVWNQSHHENEGYTIHVGRHGHVTVRVASETIEEGLDAVVRDVQVLAKPWTVAAEMLQTFAPAGPAYARVRLSDSRMVATDFGRWTTAQGPWDEDMAAIRREARRQVGHPDWEP